MRNVWVYYLGHTLDQYSFIPYKLYNPKKSKNGHFIISSKKTKFDFSSSIAGIISHLFIYLIAIQSGTSLYQITSCIIAIAFSLTLIVYLENRITIRIWEKSILNDHSYKAQTNTLLSIKIILCLAVLFTPLTFGGFSQGILNATFKFSNIYKPNSNITVSSKHLKETLDSYYSKKLIKNPNCNKNTCLINNADILFSSVGTSTKIKLPRKIETSKFITITIPNNLIYSITDSYKIEVKEIKSSSFTDKKSAKEMTNQNNRDSHS